MNHPKSMFQLSGIHCTPIKRKPFTPGAETCCLGLRSEAEGNIDDIDLGLRV